MKRYNPILLITLTCFLASCATLIRGTEENLHINSVPEQAKANISNGMSCVTPCVVRLKRNSSVVIKFEKEGCQSTMVSVFPSISGAGILLGGIIDYGTGAVYDLEPNPALGSLVCGEGEKEVVSTSTDVSVLNVQLNMGDKKDQILVTGIKPAYPTCIIIKRIGKDNYEVWEFTSKGCETELIKGYALIFRNETLVQIRKITNINDLNL